MLIVKTIDGSTFRFTIPYADFDTDPRNTVLVVKIDKETTAFFPLNNVISFSYEGVANE